MPERFGPAAAALALLLFGACGRQAPGHAVPRPGRYAYQASHPLGGSGESVSIRGVLVLRSADADRVEGYWQSEQLKGEMPDGRWKDGAYEIEALPTYTGRLVNEVTAAADGSLRCTGRYVRVAAGGREEHYPVACRLDPQGTVDASSPTPLPDARKIRPIPDSVSPVTGPPRP